MVPFLLGFPYFSEFSDLVGKGRDVPPLTIKRELRKREMCFFFVVEK